MAHLSIEQVRSLDQIRTRLMTLRSSLEKLQENLVTSQTLPSVSTLQISANVVSNSLQAISEQVTEYQELLSSTLVFPLPHYPGRYQGHILTDTLLRTKLEPDVEGWVLQGQDLAKEQSSGITLSEADRRKLWKWAPEAANKEARNQKWGADYTLAEVKAGVSNVVTGLKRELVEPDDDDNEEADEDDEEEDDDGVDDEEDDADNMDVELPITRPTNTTATPHTDGHAAIAGRPAYLETLQEFITTGRIQRYDPLNVEQRREAEKKKQSTQGV